MTHTVVVVEYHWSVEASSSKKVRPTEVYSGHGLVQGVHRSAATEFLDAANRGEVSNLHEVAAWLTTRGYVKLLCSVDLVHAMEKVDDLVHVFQWNGRLVVRRFGEASAEVTRSSADAEPPVIRATPPDTASKAWFPIPIPTCRSRIKPMRWSDFKFDDVFKSFGSSFDRFFREDEEEEAATGIAKKTSVTRSRSTSTTTSASTAAGCGRYRVVHEDEDVVVVEVDVPGFRREDLTLEARPDGFSVAGVGRRGRRSFTLKLRFAYDLDVATLVASVTDGVLTVSARKAKDRVGQKVQIL